MSAVPPIDVAAGLRRHENQRRRRALLERRGARHVLRSRSISTWSSASTPTASTGLSSNERRGESSVNRASSQPLAPCTRAASRSTSPSSAASSWRIMSAPWPGIGQHPRVVGAGHLVERAVGAIGHVLGALERHNQVVLAVHDDGRHLVFTHRLQHRGVVAGGDDGPDGARQPERGPDVAGQRRGHLPQVALSLGRGQPARIARSVIGRVQHGPCGTSGRSDRCADGLVERRAGGGVQQDRGQHPLGRDGRQLDDHASTHGVAHEDGLAHTERIKCPQRQVDPMAQVGRVAGQVRGEAVARRVEGDDQETHSRQSAQQSHIGPATQGNAMQEDQRNTLATHGYAHLVPVVQRHDVVGQPDPRSRSRLAGCRCLTHKIMVIQPRGR